MDKGNWVKPWKAVHKANQWSSIFLPSNTESVGLGVFKEAESESETSFWVYSPLDDVVSLWCHETGSGYCRVIYGLKISHDRKNHHQCYTIRD